MNIFKKNIFAGITFCTALFLCGIGQVRADVPAYEYKLIATAHASGKPVNGNTANFDLAIKITNNTAINHVGMHIDLPANSVCLKSLTPGNNNGNIVLDCKSPAITSGAFNLPPYSTRFVPLTVPNNLPIYTVRKRVLGTTVQGESSLQNTSCTASLIASVSFLLYKQGQDFIAMPGMVEKRFPRFLTPAEGDSDPWYEKIPTPW